MQPEIKQPKGYRKDKKYLAAIGQLPCFICNNPAKHVHHRIGTMKGMALKEVDWETMPLCSKHHDAVHNKPHAYNQKLMITSSRKKIVAMGLIEDKYPKPV